MRVNEERETNRVLYVRVEEEREMKRVLYVRVKEEKSACLCERERRVLCVRERKRDGQSLVCACQRGNLVLVCARERGG